MDLKEPIRKVVDGQDLTEAEAHDALGVIMDGEATPAQIAAFITALRLKGEAVDEIAGCARAMRERAQRIKPRVDDLVDIVGTGGDRVSTFNISTTTAFVVAGAGAYVAKHGNRAVSRRSGAADVLEALGVNLQVSPEVVAGCIEDVGIGFLFAPLFHAAMKHAVGPRREIGIRTIFNVLGPLTNPAGAQNLLVGTYDPGLTEIMAKVLAELGARRAMVVHGDGMDELSTLGPTRISEVRDGRVHTYTLEPQALGFVSPDAAALSGGAPDENARITEMILRGEPGPARDIILLNAGAALQVAGLAGELREGIALAGRSIDTGAAYERLEGLKVRTRAEAAS